MDQKYVTMRRKSWRVMYWTMLQPDEHNKTREPGPQHRLGGLIVEFDKALGDYLVSMQTIFKQARTAAHAARRDNKDEKEREWQLGLVNEQQMIDLTALNDGPLGQSRAAVGIAPDDITFLLEEWKAQESLQWTDETTPLYVEIRRALEHPTDEIPNLSLDEHIDSIGDAIAVHGGVT